MIISNKPILMKGVRCFLIEDDFIALNWLETTMHNEFPEIEVCGSATNVEDAVRLINHLKPDLILSDIELGNSTSFDILEQIDSLDFGIIFITSYDKYALNAIKASAIEYLLKPCNVEDLRGGLSKFLKNRIQKSQIEGLLSNLASKDKLKRLAIPVENYVELINTEDIIYFKADVNYCYIFVENMKPILVSKTLKEYDTMLAGHPSFIRIHQSYLINTEKVKKIVKTKSPQVFMSNGDVLNVSRANKAQFEQVMLKN